MQEIPDTSDKFGLDCIVDGSIPAGSLVYNKLLLCGPYFHIIEILLDFDVHLKGVQKLEKILVIQYDTNFAPSKLFQKSGTQKS